MELSGQIVRVQTCHHFYMFDQFSAEYWPKACIQLDTIYCSMSIVVTLSSKYFSSIDL